jgi:hypothetical protein
MGFIVLAEYGRWDVGQDVFGASGPDHGGLTSTTFWGDQSNLQSSLPVVEDDGRYWYNMTAVAPVDDEDGTFWYDTTMVGEDDMVAIEDGSYYYNTTLSGDMFENTTGWDFDNNLGMTVLNSSVVDEVDFNGETYYNVTVGGQSVYNSSYYTSWITYNSMTYYNVELPELLYNDTVVEYVSWFNSTQYSTDVAGNIYYAGSLVSSVDVDGETYYNFTDTELGYTNSTVDGVAYTTPDILASVDVGLYTYYQVGVGTTTFAPLAPYYNDTVVSSVNYWENVTGFSYDNDMGATFVNGSYIEEITFNGDWYSNITNVATGGTPLTAVTATVTVNGSTYTNAMWPAPFYNDTQVTRYYTVDNYQFVDFYGSFDFTTDTFGFTFGAAPYQAPQTTTSTATNIETTTSEGPGFTALVSMLTVGVIAYVAPRKRKKEN